MMLEILVNSEFVKKKKKKASNRKLWNDLTLKKSSKLYNVQVEVNPLSLSKTHTHYTTDYW